MVKQTKQSGSFTLVAIAAVVALSLTTLLVQKFSRGALHAIDGAKVERNRMETNIAALNSIARYKALVSTSKREDGVYIPTLFARDYYADKWAIIADGPIGGMVTRKGSKVTFAERSQNLSLDQIQSLMKSGTTNVPMEKVSVKLLRIHKSADRRITTSMDIVATGREANGKSQTIEVPGRLKLEVPTPYNAKIVFRKPGGALTVMRDGISLADGPYEFAVAVSGVAFDADILFNGQVLQTFGGFDENKKITHKAVSYGSKDKIIGPFFNFNPTAPAPEPDPADALTTGSEIFFTTDGTSCGYDPNAPQNIVHTLGGGTAAPPPPPPPVTAEFSVVVRGPDASTSASAGPFVVKVAPEIPPPSEDSSGGGLVTLDDYKTKCTKECPYLGDDPTGGLLGGYAAFSETQQDVAGMHTFIEAQQRWNIKDYKVCFNFQNNNPHNGTYNFHDSDVVAYDIKTCKRVPIFRRGACGCLTGDTLITLGDGVSQKRIDELTGDDTLYNPILKKAFPLRKLVQGPEEKPLVRLSWADQVINATSNHPFVSEKGVVAASALKAGDRIALPDGSWQTLDQVIQVPPEGELPIVWNLEIEAPDEDKDAHFIVANGVTSGDLVIQMDLEKKP